MDGWRTDVAASANVQDISPDSSFEVETLEASTSTVPLPADSETGWDGVTEANDMPLSYDAERALIREHIAPDSDFEDSDDDEEAPHALLEDMLRVLNEIGMKATLSDRVDDLLAAISRAVVS
jgi:hypothetical protein